LWGVGLERLKIAAFSLIELMVVVAIVVVLAAVAIPAYKNYMISTKVQSYTALLEGFKQQIINYHNRHGVFPNARDLGLPEDPDDLAVQAADPALIGPDVTQFVIGSFTCNSDLWINIDPASLGLSDIADTFYLEIMYKEVDGMLVPYPDNKWMYSYGFIAGDSITDNILPGLINQNISTGWDYTNADFDGVNTCP
jgi:prepilin-type N-terminal cleavage/methylation domain-containing protein